MAVQSSARARVGFRVGAGIGANIEAGAAKRPTAARPARAAVLAALVALLFLSSPSHAAVREKMPLRYFRSVHVLRHISPGEHWPFVAVPQAVRTHDTTSALLAHRDRAFVLETVSHDLAGAMKTGVYPEAGYYAAHAFFFRGKYREAAEAMKAYLANAPFREENYLFLVKALYASADYTGTIAAARQWQLLDTIPDTCSEDRLAYAWGSLQAMERHREAMEEVLSDPCASWRGQLFFAKSSLSLGDEDDALARTASVMAAFPDKRREIELLWDRLSASDRYP